MVRADLLRLRQIVNDFNARQVRAKTRLVVRIAEFRFPLRYLIHIVSKCQ